MLSGLPGTVEFMRPPVLTGVVAPVHGAWRDVFHGGHRFDRLAERKDFAPVLLFAPVVSRPIDHEVGPGRAREFRCQPSGAGDFIVETFFLVGLRSLAGRELPLPVGQLVTSLWPRLNVRLEGKGGYWRRRSSSVSGCGSGAVSSPPTARRRQRAAAPPMRHRWPIREPLDDP